MAIYHHVDDKDDLIELVIERVAAEVLDPPADPTAPWKDELRTFLLRFREVFIQNPGAGALFVSRPITNAAMARITERLFVHVEQGNVRGPMAAEAVDAVVLVLIGSIANDLSRPPAVRNRLLNYLPPKETPRTLANISSYSARDPEARFERALTWLLDGLEAASSGRDTEGGTRCGRPSPP